jgi:RNA polymerase sigma-70 factor (ECF subfamily)
VTEERHQRFRHLYEHTYVPLLAYALRRTRSAEDAADVVAETFAIAWRRLDEVPPGPSGLSWLYGTARGVLSNLGRKTATRSALVERLGAELSRGGGVVEDGALDGPRAVLRALAGLSDADREVLTLTAWEGLRPKELGEVLGCSPVAARLRLHRARARLRAQLPSGSPSPDFSTAVGAGSQKEVNGHGRAPVVADG